MIEGDILDDYRGDDDDRDLVQESFEYRMLLTLLWLLWGVWSFYDGRTQWGFVMEESRRLFTLLPHSMEIVYEHYFIGILDLGMAIVILKKIDDRISYLFSLLGIMLLLLIDMSIDIGALIVLIPILILLFLGNLRACLICLGFSALLFVSIFSITHNGILYQFVRNDFLLFYTLGIMSVFPYRKKLFPLSEVVIKLRYRLYVLIGLLPFILERFFY